MATQYAMKAGWCLGVSKPRHALRIYHYFPGAINLSLCRRVTRSHAHETEKEVDSGLKCAVCEKRKNEPKTHQHD